MCAELPDTMVILMLAYTKLLQYKTPLPLATYKTKNSHHTREVVIRTLHWRLAWFCVV